MPLAADIIPGSQNKPTGVSGRPGPDAQGGSSLSSSWCSVGLVAPRELEAKSSPVPVRLPSLGIYAKSASAPLTSSDSSVSVLSSAALSERSAALTSDRFFLQSAARHLLPGERVAGCLRRRQGGKDCIEVWHLPEVQRARYGNLQTCASVWMCPVCAAKITERRRLELAAALAAAKSRGMLVLMVTQTLRHNAGDTLTWLLDGLIKARKKSTGGRAAKRLREECGVVGSVRALEVTWGKESGWHPHIHELVFLAPGVSDEQVSRLLVGLRRHWENGLRLAGMRGVNEHGIDFKFADAEVAAYVEKFGRESAWRTEHELTKQPVKKGREGRFTPMDLLRSFAVDGDADAGERWREYAQTLKGSRQLFWSPGLRADLLPDVVDRTDEEVAQETDQRGNLLASLSLLTWKTILWHDARAHVLNVASGGDAAALQEFIASLQPPPVQTTRVERTTAPNQRNVNPFHVLEHEDAAALGVSWTEYRLWRRRGIEGIAVAVPAAVPDGRSPEERRQRRSGREVRHRCGEDRAAHCRPRLSA